MNLKDELIYPTVSIARELIGYRLSSVRGQNGDIPAVIHSRSNTPQLDFPYMSVEYKKAVNVGIEERDSYADVDGNETTEYDYIVTVVVRVHANNDQDALGILEEFRSRLLTNQGKRLIQEYYPTGRLLNTSQVSFFPALQVTDYQESSRMSLDFWTRSTIVDTTTGVIEDVIVDGELYEDYEQDYPPLNINTQAP